MKRGFSTIQTFGQKGELVFKEKTPPKPAFYFDNIVFVLEKNNMFEDLVLWYCGKINRHVKLLWFTKCWWMVLERTWSSSSYLLEGICFPSGKCEDTFAVKYAFHWELLEFLADEKHWILQSSSVSWFFGHGILYVSLFYTENTT